MQKASRVRIASDGQPRWGRALDRTIELEDGTEVAERDADFLAPVQPSKIIAANLTYRSCVEEHRAQTPPFPSHFLKPPSTLNGHRRDVVRPSGGRFLSYEGELAVVVGRRMKRETRAVGG